MGFFKDFKDDFSQALSELLPGDDFTEEDEIQVNTLDHELDVEKELSKLDGLLEQVEKKSSRTAQTAAPETRPVIEESMAEPKIGELVVEEPEPETVVEQAVPEEPRPEAVEEAVPEEPASFTFKPEVQAEIQAEVQAEVQEEIQAEVQEEVQAEVQAEVQTEVQGETQAEVQAEEPAEPLQESAINHYTKKNTITKEEQTMDTMEKVETIEETTTTAGAAEAESIAAVVESEIAQEITDEVSLITAGTSIKGNMETTGSFEIEGRIEGDIKCNGKLTVIGSVIGNSKSSEFFADAAHIEGEVVSSGTVKVGLGSVIIGNISATSAVIAGAVKGDVDVQGPVVVDTSAVIMGNIKSRSVQINNGAVIEGFCSQCYADVDVESLFSKK